MIDNLRETEALHQRIQILELELSDMTEALAHAWDQLDLFMKATPEHIKSTGDIVLASIMDAVGCTLGAVLLISPEKREWFTIPSRAVTPESFEQRIGDTLQTAQEPFLVSDVPTWLGQLTFWLFMPIRVNGVEVGAIGVGRHQGEQPFEAADTRILSRVAERASGQIAAASLAESQARELKIKHELQIAGLIQRSIQPLEVPTLPGLDVSADWQPAQNVGGDAWGWLVQSCGRLACFLLDVSGKGLPAALAASALHTAIKMALRLERGPAEVLRIVNEDVYDAYSNAGIFATAVVITIDPVSGVLEQASAGHPPALLRRGDDWQQWFATMPPLGVLPDASPTPIFTDLTNRDLLVLYSDGLSEIETATGLWGADGLKAAIPSNSLTAREAVNSVLAAANQARSGQLPHDDQTLLVLRYSAWQP